MWEKESYMNKSILELLLPLAAAACLITLFLLSSLNAPPAGTDLYLKPSSYSNYVNNGIVTFVYGVRNREAGDQAYSIEFYAGDALLKRDSLTLKRGAALEKTVTLEVNVVQLRLRLPAKLRIVLSKGGDKTSQDTQAVFYWLKDAS